MRIRWRGLELPSQVVTDRSTLTSTYGKFTVEPFERGFGNFISAHHGFMPEIEITGDNTAKAIWPMADELRFPQGPIAEMTGYGHYHETYQRTDGTWRIKTMRLTRLRVTAVPRS